MSKFTYSVIIPCYDAIESDFRRCLDYIKNQTLKPYEVICVDDCSPLDIPKIVLEYGFKYIRHDTNLNNGGARNTGVRAATGDYLVFCNSDDYFLPETLEEVDKKNNGENMIVIGFQMFGSSDYGYVPDTPFIAKYNWYGEPMHVVNRIFFLLNELWELEHVSCADAEWTPRLEKAVKTAAFVPKILYMYQVGHQTSLLEKISRGETKE